MHQAVHYTNLTNGLECECADNTTDRRFVRIQSTHLEQRLYTEVIEGLDYDFLYHLALGHAVIVHDRSERQRLTRAVWQGLPWAAFVARCAWHSAAVRDTHEAVLLTRAGKYGFPVTREFRSHYAALPEKTLKKFKYFRKLRNQQNLDVRLYARDCHTARTSRVP